MGKTYEAMFSNTASCPGNRNDWENQGRHRNCSKTNKVYHCLFDNNGTLGEICLKGPPAQVPKNHCPQYNHMARDVNTVPCNKLTGCPDETFSSNEVYKYPVCLQGKYTDTTESPSPSTISSVVYDGDPSSLPWLYIGVSVGVLVLLIILIIVAVVCFRRSRLCHRRGSVTK
ncbi:uncharacterized protein LOC134253539 [Saccostrea cucullata]|uniref:uncharacterized protein LOC134253539 n=1 Tax=Saccostrea cuccullata TaxID=36930 RepID=UPI002ED1FDB7